MPSSAGSGSLWGRLRGHLPPCDALSRPPPPLLPVVLVHSSLFRRPGRLTRPKKLVILLRGLPGSGKVRACPATCCPATCCLALGHDACPSTLIVDRYSKPARRQIYLCTLLVLSLHPHPPSRRDASQRSFSLTRAAVTHSTADQGRRGRRWRAPASNPQYR